MLPNGKFRNECGHDAEEQVRNHSRKQFEKRFSSKWYEAYFMLPSLMVSVMVFL